MIAAALGTLLVLLGLLALLHLALVFGAPLGRLVWGGAEAVLPAGKRFASLAAVILLGGFALIALDRAGSLELFLSPAASRIAGWALAAVLVLSVFQNLLSSSRAERRVMLPLSAVLALCSLVLALAP